MIKLNISEWGQEEEFLVYKNSISIGSNPNNDLVLMDKSLPKKIANINIISDTTVELFPIEAVNLTLNGQLIETPTLILIGDKLQISKTNISIISLSLQNPFIATEEEIAIKISTAKEKNPELGTIIDYLDKVSRDV